MELGRSYRENDEYIFMFAATFFFLGLFCTCLHACQNSPSFEVSVEGTLVFSWRSPWPEDISRSGAYSDLIAFISDGEANICFYSIATDPPVIASLELIQIDPASYDAVSTGNTSILVNYGRLTCGSDQWGPGFSNDTDLFFRSWQSDAEFRSPNSIGIKSLSSVKKVINTNQSPNYFPAKLYSTAVTATGAGGLEYELQVDVKLDYLLWFHFAEIDVSVNRMGKTVQAIALVLAKREFSRAIGESNGVLSSPSSSTGLPEIKATLVICPLVAVIQWVNEIDRFTSKGNNQVLVYHGVNRGKTLHEFSEYDFIITTYSIVESEYKKNVMPPKQKCQWCGKLYYEHKMAIHLKYFCGYCVYFRRGLTAGVAKY